MKVFDNSKGHDKHVEVDPTTLTIGQSLYDHNNKEYIFKAFTGQHVICQRSGIGSDEVVHINLYTLKAQDSIGVSIHDRKKELRDVEKEIVKKKRELKIASDAIPLDGCVDSFINSVINSSRLFLWDTSRNYILDTGIIKIDNFNVSVTFYSKKSIMSDHNKRAYVFTISRTNFNDTVLRVTPESVLVDPNDKEVKEFIKRNVMTGPEQSSRVLSNLSGVFSKYSHLFDEKYKGKFKRIKLESIRKGIDNTQKTIDYNTKKINELKNQEFEILNNGG